MEILAIVLVAVWLYSLRVFHKAKLSFFKFLVGSVGMFLFMMWFIQPAATAPLAQLVTAVSGYVGDLTGMYEAYYQYAILFIQHNGQSISMYVDYECAGIIEILAFVSLLWFYPVYSVTERFVLTLAGVLWVFLGNILRLVIIASLIYFFGNDIFFFAHAIFGRIVFYALTAVLYFNVFTKAHILRQKIGKFNYGNTRTDT